MPTPDQKTNDVIARIAQAEANYAQLVVDENAKAVAPVQAQLDKANQAIADLRAQIDANSGAISDKVDELVTASTTALANEQGSNGASGDNGSVGGAGAGDGSAGNGLAGTVGAGDGTAGVTQ